MGLKYEPASELLHISNKTPYLLIQEARVLWDRRRAYRGTSLIIKSPPPRTTIGF